MRDMEYRAVAREPSKAHRKLTERLDAYRVRLDACEGALSAVAPDHGPFPHLKDKAQVRLGWARAVEGQMQAALDRRDVGLAASAGHYLQDLILACEYWPGLIRAICPATGSGSPPLPQETISC